MIGIEDTDVERLASFMGHYKDIYKDVYRMPVPLSEMTKVARMLEVAIGEDDNEDGSSDEDGLQRNEKNNKILEVSAENNGSSDPADEDCSYSVMNRKRSQNCLKDSHDFSEPSSSHTTVTSRCKRVKNNDIESQSNKKKSQQSVFFLDFY